MRRTLYEADHDAFRETVRRFVAKEIAPRHVEWEAAGIVPRELYTSAGAQGLLGWAVPEEFGGGGQSDFRFNAVLGEEVVAAGVAGSGTSAVGSMRRPRSTDLRKRLRSVVKR